MLEKVNLKRVMIKEEYKQEAALLEERLGLLQQRVKQNKLSVLILFDGWGAAGKGSLISKLILNFDPRGFRVQSFVAADQAEQRRPLLWRYWNHIPAQGEIAVFDRSWYQDITTAQLESSLSKSELKRRIQSIKTMERQLSDDGTLLLKFFLHIDQKEQKKRFEKLEDNKNTAWRVTAQDWKRNKHYDEYYRVFDQVLTETNTDYAPWHIVGGHDRYSAVIDIYRTVADEIEAAIEQRVEKLAHPVVLPPQIASPEGFDLVSVPKLSQISLSKQIEPERYKEELKDAQDTLKKLHNKLYRKKIPVVIAYEGWDAAGKGGNIKRVAAALDPRGYEVIPIAAPDKNELAHHYLWRFWNRLPKTGHVAIFDRTWYGRVMVERIEGFCTDEAWHRAYREINEFEKELSDWGAVIVKFWIHIDSEEQLRRFNERQNTPSKQWKITEEDWRNRDKWDQYENAVNDMLQYTSTDFAPWHIIESQDKKFARVKALRVLISAIEDRLDRE